MCVSPSDKQIRESEGIISTSPSNIQIINIITPIKKQELISISLVCDFVINAFIQRQVEIIQRSSCRIEKILPGRIPQLLP
jgi:hypothetical protein